jgi:chromosome segregation ATPase
MRSQTAVLLISFTVLAPALAQAPQRMYKCVDAKGKVYYTQVPPRECLGRETQELNKSGSVIKKSERAATPAEVQAREAERKKKAEADERIKEERRKNTALLNTYSSEKDIEDQRARALKEAQDAIAATEKSIAGAQKRQKDLETEKEFYVKKPMPFKLKNEINNVEMEIKNQTALLEAKKKEINTINAKYDEDKRRYVELTAAAKK